MAPKFSNQTNNMTDTIAQLDKPERKAIATQEVVSLAEKHGGTITPEIILAEAKSKRSPLHGFFCWDNNEAAAEYRRIQAAQLIRRIKVTITGGDEKHIRVRAFVNVVEPTPTEDEPEEIDGHGINCRPRGIYVSLQQAVRIDDYKEQMIRQCKRDVEAFRSKYSALSEASRIIEAMDGFTTAFTMQ
jgi:hypothetical protein